MWHQVSYFQIINLNRDRFNIEFIFDAGVQMDQLEEAVKDFSDEYLLDQFTKHSEEYTPDALKLLGEEIERRKISSASEPEAGSGRKVRTGTLELDSEDFMKLDHYFTHTDVLLAVAMLRDNNLLFFIGNEASGDTIPLQSEASKRFTLHVHKSNLEEAHRLLDEHFDKADGLYQLRCSGARDRLKVFSFSDIRITDVEAKEKIEVVLSEDEKSVIIKYGNRLLSEADQIEEQQERVLFYYDCIEQVIESLESGKVLMMYRSDLLTILEILQVYCGEPDFPSDMDETISSLLGFFTEV